MPADIPHVKVTLDNGLDVIVHEDRHCPIVAVNVWYHVGSKNERPGRTGFAHLFEHLMFEGSEHHDSGYFRPLQEAGGTLNGSTSADRTNYWEVVPSGALERALWMESDRMGYLLPALTREKLDTQRDVVLNERRQSYENRPYGLASMALMAAHYPAEHPYHWPVIGWPDDVRAATLDDVRDFFATYYHPANASLAIAGDVRAADAIRAARAHFEEIPVGPVPPPVAAPLPARGRSSALLLEDRVESPRLYLGWVTPRLFGPSDAELDLAATVLAGGKSSRLYRALLHDRRLAIDVTAYQHSLEVSGHFSVVATAAPDRKLHELEVVISAEIARLATDGPTRAELERARHLVEADHAWQRQSVGGFGGRSDLLNTYNVYTGTPAYAAADLDRYLEATPESVTAAVSAELGTGSRVALSVVSGRPRRRRATRFDAGGGAVVAVDRSGLPSVGAGAALRFPAIERETLSNGVRLWTVDHHETDLISFVLLVPSGSAADPPGHEGLAAFTADLLDNGTRRRSGIDLHDALGRIGGRLGTDVTSDATVLSITALARHARDALALLIELATEPSFEPEEVERVRALRIGRIAQMRHVGAAVAERAFLRSVYGTHPYGHSPAGTLTSLERTTVDDIRAFHAAHYAPARWTLIRTGGGTSEPRAELASVVSDIPHGGLSAVPDPAPADADDAPANRSPAGRLTFVPRAGAVQSELRIGHVGVLRRAADYPAVMVMNMVLGGQFVSRLNLNLREARGYTYGVRTSFDGRRRPGPFVLQTAVDAAVTGDAIREAVREIGDIRAARPVTGDELAAARPVLTSGFARNFETAGQVAHAAMRLALFELPDDEYTTFVSRVAAVDAGAAAGAARCRLDPEALRVVVVGPPDVRPSLAALDFGEPVDATVDEFVR